jgi:hypothetical protein
MCFKIDVMERECKNLEFGSDLNKAWIYDQEEKNLTRDSKKTNRLKKRRTSGQRVASRNIEPRSTGNSPSFQTITND